MKFRKPLSILFVILLLGAILRGINISSNPPSLYGDELTLVYDAYSIIKTSQDQLGNYLPLTFPMGAGRPGGYIYFSIPFVYLFGPTALGIRALSVLSGIGIILLIYLISKRIFSTRVGLASAFLSAISIWGISLSRAGFEANFALFLVCLGIYAFLKATEKPILYTVSAASFGLALHTYPTYKLTLVLFLPLLVWFSWQNWQEIKKKTKYILPSFFLLILFVVLAIVQTFTSGSEERFSQINIFSQKDTSELIVQKINYERTISRLPDNLVPLFHNKPVEYFKIIGENYLKNLSMNFLFIHGDRNPRHNMSTMGQLYIADIILLVFGILALGFKQIRKFIFLVGWILIAAMGSVLINEPHALRSSFMLPPLLILSAIGITYIFESLSGKYATILKIFVIFAIVFQFLFFVQKLFFLAPYEYKHFWSILAKRASEIALDEKDRFGYVFVSDKIDNVEYAYPVYAKVDPNQVINQNKKLTEVEGYRFKKLGNVYIGNLNNEKADEFLGKLDKTSLYIGLSDNFNETENLDENLIFIRR